MKVFLKKALLLLSLIITLTALFSCLGEAANSNQNSHICIFTNYVSNENATCQSDGTKTAFCSICGAYETITDVGSGGHLFEEYHYNYDATCIEDGTKTAKCERCFEFDIVTESNTAHGHEFICTDYDENYHWKKCFHCGISDGNEIMHTLNDNGVCSCEYGCQHEELTASTCISQAICSKCGNPYGELSEEHAIADIEAVAPTCIETGLTAGVKCSLCNIIIIEQETIAKLGHTFTTYYTNNDATIDTDGTKTAVCDREGCIEEDTVTEEKSAWLEFTLSSDRTYYTVKKWRNQITSEISIPEIYDNLPVKSIGKSAFSGCVGLESVEIPSSVTSIGEFAFYNCTGLKNIEIPTSVTSIGASAFYNCTGLENIEIPTSVTSIGESAFYKCTGLTSIEIPASVTNIGESVFLYCSKLAEIKVSESNTSYKSVSGNLYTKDGTELVQYAVAKSDSAFTVPADVTRIHKNSFSGALNIRSVTFGDNLTYIGDNAFYGCSFLSDLNFSIDGSPMSIGPYAFKCCFSLKNVVIPSRVKIINIGAFSACSGIESISLPFVGQRLKASDEIHQYPFGFIFGKENYDGGVVTTQEYIDGFYTNGVRYCDTDNYYIPASLKTVNISGGDILYGAFSGCSTSLKIIIGEGVTKIENGAFNNSTGVEYIYIPSSLVEINEDFSDCYSLETIVVNENNAVYKSIEGNLYSKDGTKLIWCPEKMTIS